MQSLIQLEDFLQKTGPKLESVTLPIPLGIDGMGNYVLEDLRTLGHILIGGVTGSGKSMFYHTTICTLIQKYSPQDLQFYLLDLKRVELMPYDGIPHLISKVETEPEACLVGLAKMTVEKNSRVRILEKKGCKNIEEYNDRFAKEKMPYLVVIIDTFSDLCVSCFKDRFEQLVRHLSENAQSVGIHLIMCDSRTSEALFTKKIKACFPTKIAFEVVEKAYSIDLLGMAGAEELLGRGDMLILYPFSKKAMRLQAPMISYEDAKLIVAVKKSAQALGHLNPDSHEILSCMGIYKPSQEQVAAVERIMQRENVLTPQEITLATYKEGVTHQLYGKTVSSEVYEAVYMKEVLGEADEEQEKLYDEFKKSLRN